MLLVGRPAASELQRRPIDRAVGYGHNIADAPKIELGADRSACLRDWMVGPAPELDGAVEAEGWRGAGKSWLVLAFPLITRVAIAKVEPARSIGADYSSHFPEHFDDVLDIQF